MAVACPNFRSHFVWKCLSCHQQGGRGLREAAYPAGAPGSSYLGIQALVHWAWVKRAEEHREQPGPSTESLGSEQEIGPGPWVPSFDNSPQLAGGSSGFLPPAPHPRDHTLFQGVEPSAKGTLPWGLNEQTWLLVRVCSLACQQAGAISADSPLTLIPTSPFPAGNL